MAANFWEEIFGEQIILNENLGGKIGNRFFLKQVFLGGNFWEQVLEEQILMGRKFRQQKYFGGTFYK